MTPPATEATLPPATVATPPTTGTENAEASRAGTRPPLAAARPGKAEVTDAGGPTALDMAAEGIAGVRPEEPAHAASAAMANEADPGAGLPVAVAEEGIRAADPLAAIAGHQTPAAEMAEPNGAAAQPTEATAGQTTASQATPGQPGAAQAGNGFAAGPSVPGGLAASGPAAPPPRPPSPAAFRQVAPIAIALASGPGRSPRLTVALEPEELGRVEIRIERATDTEAATIHVLAERPETLALLQRDARELDRALQQAGIKVAEGGTSFGLSDQERPAREQSGNRRQPGRPHVAAAAAFTTIRPAGPGLSLLDIAV